MPNDKPATAHVEVLTAELDRIRTDLAAARRIIAETQAIHFPYLPAHANVNTCAGCNIGMEIVLWPCKTIRAINGDTDG